MKGVQFNDFPLRMTILCDLCVRKVIPAHSKAVAHRDKRFWAPETEEDIRLISSMKALINGSETLLELIKQGAEDKRVYSRIMLMPAKNKIMDSVQPANISRICLCQLLGACSENDLL